MRFTETIRGDEMVPRIHGSEHHVIPRSRNGSDSPANIVFIDPELHTAWHTLFHNFLVQEAIILLQTHWRDHDGTLKASIFGEKQREAWLVLFGNASCDEAIIIIKKMFIEKDKAYLRRDGRSIKEVRQGGNTKR